MTVARFVLLAVSTLALGTVACVNTDPAVFVEAEITGPSAKLTPSSVAGFGATLEGVLAVSLHLGARASGSSRVSLRTFSLTNADQTVTLVGSLPVAFADASQHDPIEVAPDSTVLVPLTYTTGSALLAADKQKAICEASGLRIVGGIQDSLQSGATPLMSAVFAPTGCP